MSIDLISASLSLLSPFLSDKAGSRPLIRPRLSLFSDLYQSVRPSFATIHKEVNIKLSAAAAFAEDFNWGSGKFMRCSSSSSSSYPSHLVGKRNRFLAETPKLGPAKSRNFGRNRNSLFRPKYLISAQKKAVLAVYTLY